MPPEGGFEVLIAGSTAVKDCLSQEMKEAGWRFVACDGNRSEALNQAVYEARGAWWAFADDDCVFPSDWLLNLSKVLAESPSIAALGGSDVLSGETDGFALALDVVLNSWLGTGGIRTDWPIKTGRYYPKLWNMSVSAAAARSAAAHSGQIFDPLLDVHEDVDLIERIRAQNGTVIHAPSVRVDHHRDTDFQSFFFRNMAMAAACGRKGIHRAPHLFLTALFAGIPLLFLCSSQAPALKPVACGLAGLYLLAALLTGIHGAWIKKRLSLVAAVPCVLFAMHLARVLGYLGSLLPQTRANP
jgi:hypothetical protein